jgi:two-component system chemotaxis sensor kinase CheA
MVVTLSAVAALLIGLLVTVSVRLSQRYLADVEAHHREALASKATALAESNAVVLKGLALDDVSPDAQRLIERLVLGDPDVVYGMLTSRSGRVLAFAGPGASTDRPDPNACASVDLGPQSPNVSGHTMRELTAFGQYVFEVALPVLGGSETSGTLRLGLSERSMHAAVRAAREASQRDILTSLALALAAALAAAGVAAMASRRAAARIAKPVADLAAAAKALAAGDRDVRVDIRSDDEVEDLGQAFNDMVAKLKESHESLEEMNRTLETRVEARTNELASRNRDMRTLLDNVEDGLLTLSPSGVMAMEHSAILDRWFGAYAENTSFGAYLERTSPAFSAYLSVAWEAIAAGFLPLEVCIEQLPRHIEARGRTWQVRYTPIMSSGRLDVVLVVVRDITGELTRQREEQAQRDLLNAFQRLMRDRAGFMAFHAEMTDNVAAVCSGQHDSDPLTLKRIVHTIKGNAGIFGLEQLEALCHRIEEEMIETRDLPPDSSIDELREAWQTLTDNIIPKSRSKGPTFDVPSEEVQELIVTLDSIPAARHLATQVEGWKLEPIQVPLRRLAEQAAALAKRLGKGDIQVEVQAELIRYDSKRWAPLWSDLVHVVRNAVDHGLEMPDERKTLGKPPATIRLTAAWEGPDLVVTISDDGRGISFEAVRAKATRLGLSAETHEDLVAALFVDGVSTAESVSAISGRGVGMSVVRARVEAMGGAVTVHSVPGKGTTWTFRFRRQPSMDGRGSLRPSLGASLAPVLSLPAV